MPDFTPFMQGINPQRLSMFAMSLILLAACGAPGQSVDTPTGSPTTALSTPLQREVGNASDTAIARADLPVSSDMSKDWVQVGAGDDPPSSFATKSFCIAGYPSYIAGSWVDFSNHFDPVSGNEHGHLAAEVRLTNSDADAKSQLELLRGAIAPTTNTSDCVLQSYMSSVAVAAGQANVLPGARILAVGDAPAGLTGQIIHASVPYRFQGAISVYYFDDIRVQQGRVVARLLFSVCCHAFDFATVERPVIDAVSRRMAASAATAA